MDVLVLGGTAFLGRAVARAALADGATVTCLARGSAAAPDGVRLVRADRDRTDALAAVADRSWDAVVDLTRQPGHARRAARELRARHWVFVSSVNVYTRFDRPEQAEDADVHAPLGDDVMTDMSQYGPAKVACENAVRDRQDSWTVLRSGLIGGPGDETGRVGYYPWRFAHPTGDDVLVPPDPTFPCSIIDVRDLAAWIVACARGRVQGVFNAGGPTTPLGEVLEAAREVAGSDAALRPVPAGVLTEAGVSGWMGPSSLPLWVDDPDWRFFASHDGGAARAAGLTTRDLRDTLRAALRDEEARTTPRLAGLSDDDERRVRALLP